MKAVRGKVTLARPPELGPVEIEAELIGPFAIHQPMIRIAQDPYDPWVLTHIATGHKVRECVKLRGARKLAKALLHLDWDFTVQDFGTERYKALVAAAKPILMQHRDLWI